MRRDTVKYKDFTGIVESVANPVPNSFEDLLNLRLDRKLGGLTNRYGFANAKDITYQPDAVAYTSFSDSGSALVLAGAPSNAGKIEVDPSFELETGNATPGITDLTTAIANNTISSIAIDGTSKLVKLVLGTSLPGVQASKVSRYQIIYNSTRLTYAVVVDQTALDTIWINTDAYVSLWQAGDSLSFYKNDLLIGTGGFTRTIASNNYPLFQNIDAYNNLVLSGIKESTCLGALWVGRIGTKLGASGEARKYFGGEYHQTLNPTGAGFAYNGHYVTRFVEDFLSGAFRANTHHIEVKKATAITTLATLVPTYDVSSGGTWTNQGGGAPGFFYDEISDASDVSYLVTSNVNANFKVGFTSLASGLDINRNGYVTLRTRMKTGGSSVTQYVYVLFEVVEFVGAADVARTYMAQLMIGSVHSAFTEFSLQIPASIFTDINKVRVQCTYLAGNTTLVLSEVTLYVDLSQATQAVDNTGKNPIYAVNFSAELDNANETPLIYPTPMGTIVNNSTSYADTSKVTLDLNSTTNYVGVKIKTSYAPLINRRITALRVYCGVFVSGIWVWRYCQRVAMDNPNWKREYAGGVDQYSIELQLGNEVNTGEVYEDRTGRSSSSTLQKDITTIAKPGSRAFVVNSVDHQTIYYSQISNNGYETSIIPSSNFIVVNDTIGDIVWLTSLGAKLLIFKSQSLLAIDAYSAVSAPRIQVISRERGTAAPRSVATNGLVAFYVAQDGVYLTDGFKEQQINQAWIEVFRQYSLATIQGAIGFFDAFTDTYYVQFNPSTDNYDLWGCHIPTGDWRKEDFQYTDTQKFGAIKYVTRALDNRNLLVDDLARTTSAYMQMYMFPRDYQTDPTKAYTNKIRTVNGTQEWGTKCRFKTNAVDNSGGITEAYYIDGGYVKSNAKVGQSILYASTAYNASQVTSVDLKLYDGATIVKTIPIEWGREETSSSYRAPLSRFSVYSEFYVRGLFSIKEFGLYFKQLLRSGSIKQNA